VSTYEVEASDGSLGARRWALAQVPGWSGAGRDRLESIVGELVANAIEHGTPPVTLQLDDDAGPGAGPRLTVQDGGRGPGRGPGTGRGRPVTGERERGRGLGIVHALGTEVRSAADADGYRVVVELDAGW
jgi:anti-sigma regulatory factor (Ser/Thr protein kinase)